MNLLPQTLVDHVRSFWRSEQIYQSTRVCKAWRDISNVPRNLYVNIEEGYPMPPHAENLSKIYSLSISDHSNSSEIIDLIRRCAPGLRSLSLSFCDDVATAPITRLPSLEKVTDLWLYHLNPMESLNNILRSTPNLKKLWLSGDGFPPYTNLDFALIPRLKYLKCVSPLSSSQNFSHVFLSEIECGVGWPLGSMAEFIETQNAHVKVSQSIYKETLDQTIEIIRQHPNVEFILGIHLRDPYMVIGMKVSERKAQFRSLFIDYSCEFIEKEHVESMKLVIQKFQSVCSDFGIMDCMETKQKRFLMAFLALTDLLPLGRIASIFVEN